jgi:oligopeptide transport system ATP-binding protein
MQEELLDIKNLKTTIRTESGLIHAVNDVTITIKKGEIIGIVGESGSGKTMTALSIIGLLPEPYAKIESGSVFFKGRDLVSYSKEEMRMIRGKEISMVFQDSMSALNPIMNSGKQIQEELLAHFDISVDEAKAKIISLFSSVGIPEPEIRFRQHPYEMSGGMRQRIMIAMALACDPSLIIADEPTTNLDVSIQAQILELLKKIRNETGASILLITHNLGIVAWLCDRVYVMYGGEIMESGAMETLLTSPSHPYTTLLLKSVPRADEHRARLEAIPGDVPDLRNPPSGCVFNPRCPYAKRLCQENHPGMFSVATGQEVRCLMYDPKFKGEWEIDNA